MKFFFFTWKCDIYVIYQTIAQLFGHISKHRGEVEKWGTAEFFNEHSRCLEIWWFNMASLKGYLPNIATALSHVICQNTCSCLSDSAERTRINTQMQLGLLSIIYLGQNHLTIQFSNKYIPLITESISVSYGPSFFPCFMAQVQSWHGP